jgi:branched-chain amino acid transport system ATP-binding protein
MLLQVENLNTYYGESHALRNFSLTVGEGEIVALLGRNGMGKSTALKSIMGLVRPSSGRVLYRGADLTGAPPYRVARAGIGYVPEERRIFPNLSVRDNLSMGVKQGRAAATAAGHATTWTLERIYQHFDFMRDRGEQKGRLLSGGEQQMLAIARTLMGNPHLLLVDEPTEGLAPLLVKEVRDVLAEINQAGVSILLVEHNLKVAMSLAHRVYLMGKAHVGFSGTVAELAARPEIRAQYLEV